MTQHIRKQLEMYGAQTLSSSELLTYILGTSTQDAALKLLETYNLSQVPSADWADFMSRAGLSKAQAQRLNAVCELARRLAEASPEQRIKIKSSGVAMALLKPMMANLDHEEFRVLCLDSRLQVVSNILLYRGNVTGCAIRVPEVFKEAIVRKCPSILVAHNHPTGLSEPTSDDLETTKEFLKAAEFMDIELVDHLIIGNPRSTSLKVVMGW